MPNALCEPACLGFPVHVAPAVPTTPVICSNDNLVVQAPKTNLVSRQGGSEAAGPLTLASGMTVSMAYIQPAFTNPFDVAMAVTVDHEFAIEAGLCFADEWAIYGDINCAGTGVTLHSGGTTGQFLLHRHDGTNHANNNEIEDLFLRYALSMLYYVPAQTTFNIGMLTRLEAITIRGGFRSVMNAYTAMTVNGHPRYV